MKQKKKTVIVVFAVLKILVLALVILVFVHIGKTAYSFDTGYLGRIRFLTRRERK